MTLRLHFLHFLSIDFPLHIHACLLVLSSSLPFVPHFSFHTYMRLWCIFFRPPLCWTNYTLFLAIPFFLSLRAVISIHFHFTLLHTLLARQRMDFCFDPLSDPLLCRLGAVRLFSSRTVPIRPFYTTVVHFL